MADRPENFMTVLTEHWGVIAGAAGAILTWTVVTLGTVLRIGYKTEQRMRDLEEGKRMNLARINNLEGVHCVCVQQRRDDLDKIYTELRKHGEQLAAIMATIGARAHDAN